MASGEGRYRAVVIGASLGGAEALQVLLGGLTTELPVPVMVVQHLRMGPSRLHQLLARTSTLPVAWAADGETPAPGRVHLCPPRHRMRLEPDGTLTVSANRQTTSMGQIDALFESVAGALPSGVLAVVLTGMGSDGTAGARAVRDADGIVVVQDEATSTAFSMPSSVIDAGAASLVLPLAEIPGLLDEVVGRGRRVPVPEVLAAEAIFAHGGELGRTMSDIDWSSSALGPVESWPETLRTTLATVLANDLPMAVLWGREATVLYNDAYARDVLGDRHPVALGRPALEIWPEDRAEVERVLDRVWDTGRAVLGQDEPSSWRRSTGSDELYTTFTYSPLRSEGRLVGVLHTVVVTTEAVRNARRLRTLQRLAATADGGDERAACERAAAVLAASPADVPFALVYLPDGSGRRAHLAAAAGLESGTPLAPHVVTDSEPAAWPVLASVRERRAHIVDDLPARFPAISSAAPVRAPRSAVVLSAGNRGNGTPAVAVVLAVNPQTPLDSDYRSFLDLVAEQIATSVLAARRRREADDRIAAMTELNRKKTEFFSNVSHEFRTPLTLMLLPLERLMDDALHLRREDADAVRLVHRNALRLLKLVNTLLDFARIEQGRLPPRIEVIDDLAGLTAELAGVFRSAAESAGLDLIVNCPPLETSAHLDPEMWERIVLNLVSNALKHTFTGSITVTLRRLERHVELEVADTGVGIPEDELSAVFTRFHRVRGTRARSQEGSGIGLAQVDGLARLLGGSVRVRSVVAEGSRFTVWLPLRVRRADPAPPVPRDELARATERLSYAEEAALWLSNGGLVPDDVRDAPAPAPALPGRRRSILLVDDNADLRAYVSRLLADRYDITAVATGRQALEELDRHHFELVLADVLMPEMDGLELLSAIRTDPALRSTPVILLTAVAQASHTAHGLAAGAHDYIVKPFTARELVARVDAQLSLAQLRDGSDALS